MTKVKSQKSQPERAQVLLFAQLAMYGEKALNCVQKEYFEGGFCFVLLYFSSGGKISILIPLGLLA